MFRYDGANSATSTIPAIASDNAESFHRIEELVGDVSREPRFCDEEERLLGRIDELVQIG